MIDEEPNTICHVIKIYKRFHERIINGAKPWELRRNDRDYQVGDLIIFDIMDGGTGTLKTDQFQSQTHYRITYLYQGPGLEKDWVLMTLEPIATQHIHISTSSGMEIDLPIAKKVVYERCDGNAASIR